MKHLDLFSGIGGFALACEWLGIPTICFVEIDKYCQKVLKKHWPNVPIVEDIRDVERIKEIVANAKQVRCTRESPKGQRGDIPESSCLEVGSCSEYGMGRIRPESPAILVTGGFPCQPFSVAGKRGGEGDDRYLWPETIAVIEAVRPRWVLLENVTGIINLALDTVLSDLEGTGYSCETLIIPACAVNAWHRRDRIWIIAWDTEGNGGYQKRRVQEGENAITRGVCGDVPNPKGRKPGEQTEQEGGQGSSGGSQEDVPNTPINGSEAGVAGQDKGQEGESGELVNDSEISSHASGEGLQRQRIEHKLREVCREEEATGCDWWATEPGLGRVAYGIPNRVDRLKCLGNAIVPQVAYEVIKVIKEVNG